MIDLILPINEIIKSAAKTIFSAVDNDALKGVIVCTDKEYLFSNASLIDHFDGYLKHEIISQCIGGVSDYFKANDDVCGRSGSFTSYENGRDYEYIAFNTSFKNTSKFSLQDDEFKRVSAFITYHELAHKILDDNDITRCEDLAETFAALIYVRDFSNTDMFGIYPYSKTYNALNTAYEGVKGVYNNSNVLLAAGKVADQVNLQELTVKEIADITVAIVDRYAQPQYIRDKIYNAYNEYWDEDQNIYTPILIEALAETADEDVFRAGMMMLKSYHVKEYMKSLLDGSDENGQAIHEYLINEMTELDKKTDRLGIILNPVDAIDAKNGNDGIAEITAPYKSGRVNKRYLGLKPNG